MSTDYKFEGWLGKDPSSVEGNMVWESYDPKPFDETDVDIKISHCGVSCGFFVLLPILSIFREYSSLIYKLLIKITGLWL